MSTVSTCAPSRGAPQPLRSSCRGRRVCSATSVERERQRARRASARRALRDVRRARRADGAAPTARRTPARRGTAARPVREQLVDVVRAWRGSATSCGVARRVRTARSTRCTVKPRPRYSLDARVVVGVDEQRSGGERRVRAAGAKPSSASGRPSPLPGMSGSTPMTKISPSAGSRPCGVVDLAPVEAGEAVGVECASRKSRRVEPGVGHAGAASVASIQPPCSGWFANARLFTSSHAASSRPGSKSRTVMPGGQLGRSGRAGAGHASRRGRARVRSRRRASGASSSGRRRTPSSTSRPPPCAATWSTRGVDERARRRRHRRRCDREPDGPVLRREVVAARDVHVRTCRRRRKPAESGPGCAMSRHTASFERRVTLSRARTACVDRADGRRDAARKFGGATAR